MYQFKIFIGVWVVEVLVWMCFYSSLVVCALDLGVLAGSGETEDLVVVCERHTVAHCHVLSLYLDVEWLLSLLGVWRIL